MQREDLMSWVSRPLAAANSGYGAMLVLLAALVMLGGCAGRTSDIPYAPSEFNVEPDSLFAANTDYRLGPTDLVTVTVFRAPELTGDYRVDESGNINLPLIGQTSVQGMTTTQAADALRQSLSARYYVDPNVTVAVREGTSQRITVDGSVQAPGIYPIPGRTTLMQAVAMARGTTPDANLHRVVVFRQIQGQRMAAAFDLSSIRSAEMEDPVVFASDIIIVDGSQTRQTLRDVISVVPVLALFRPFVF